jgi:hypothetical protein
LQPLLIKKTVPPNENKNIGNNLAAGYMSNTSQNSAMIKNMTLRTIKEENGTPLQKAPANLQPVILAGGSQVRPPRAVSRPSGQNSSVKTGRVTNPMNSSFEGFNLPSSKAGKRELSGDA